MSAFLLKLRALFLLLSLGLVTVQMCASWADKSTGLPVLQYFSAKELGPGEEEWLVLEDRFGRLFVGGEDSLQVFDGQSWRSFPVGTGRSLLALAFGTDGRLWAGAMNEIGYFTEESLGLFQYHSLISRLPKDHQLVGVVWGCAQVGQAVYFICSDKILRWDGTTFRIQSYDGATHLFPIKLGDEYWFQHLETGLYRLTEAGPRLEIPAVQLPKSGILGLTKDETGFLVASGSGLYRPGLPPRQISNDQFNRHLMDNHLASFIPLPGGNYAFGTKTGGMVITTRTGVPLRVLDPGDGLPTRYVYAFRTDSNGYLWFASPAGIGSLEATGNVSLFNALNGLKGKVSALAHLPDSRLLASTEEGVFQLTETSSGKGEFQQLSQPKFTASYDHLLPVSRGFLLFGLGGMDLFDGSTVRNILSLTGSGVYSALPARADPKILYILESSGLSRLTEQPDGSFAHAFLAKLPDFGLGMHEDSTGRLWLGNASRGAFVYEPTTQQLTPVRNPNDGQALSGRVFVVGTAKGIVLLGRGQVLVAQPDGTGLKGLAGAPAIDSVVAIPAATAEGQALLVAFNHVAPANTSIQGLGLLTVEASGQIRWHELDVPAIGRIGSVSTMEFTVENGRPILWIGGTAGALRLDYDTLQPVQKPSPPFLQLDMLHAGRVQDATGFAFSFQHHRINFKVFTGEYTRTKDWLVQSRLGNGEWSAPAARRSFEFSNLSEGDYRFEVRTVNAAGLASEPAAFTFRILPPWYRSGWAFAGYSATLGLMVFGLIRYRERQIRARNLQLETLVGIRTAELVKANAAKDEFLAGISHEIRNPMNGVIGIADNFRTEGLDQDSRRKFSLLRQCATHLSSLLEDILDFSKVQAGAVEIEAKPFDLPGLMDSIAAMTAAESEKRGIPVEIAISPAVPTQLVGDAKRVRQILLNFVGNALKFSGRGQVSVTVWCKPPSPASTEVIFAVSDEGPGISPEEQQRLFTRFERGAAAQQGRVPGTGLGLALCKGLAEKMGGRIWLESEPGQGSCFSFSAPFAIIETLPPPVPTPASGPPKVALVVDDQDYNRVVLTDLLEALGFAVHTAGDGTAALALAAGQDFDAVFLDYNLPGLSGLEVARGIRALPNKSAQAIILATTAFSTPEKRNQCLAAGMNAFLGKPVTMERLRKALASALPAGPAPTPAAPARPPADGLANLRLLARKKGVEFAGELALYLSEFEVELDQLDVAVQREDTTATGHYAHLLYGRCAFIGERELEQTLRKIEAESATGQWDGVRLLRRDLATQVAGLRVRLAFSAPIAPPA